jgi:hypothetical protein
MNRRKKQVFSPTRFLSRQYCGARGNDGSDEQLLWDSVGQIPGPVPESARRSAGNAEEWRAGNLSALTALKTAFFLQMSAICRFREFRELKD